MSTSNAKSNYLEQKIIEAVLKNTTYTAGANTYLALFTATADGEANSVTEVTGGSYARQAIAASTGWSAGGQVSGVYEVSNAADILFPVATADWGSITGFALYDALTSGNELYYGVWDVAKSILTNDQYKVSAGTLKINEG